jgi:carboxylate-amine ligase
VRQAADALGLRLASAGSHPFARHRERLVYPAERYQGLIDRNRWVARRLMVFGLHVHVGMRSGEHAMATINGLLPYLPHLLALSASSPFWQGSDTGLASSRISRSSRPFRRREAPARSGTGPTSSACTTP